MVTKLLVGRKALGAGLGGGALGLIGDVYFGCFVSCHGHEEEKRALVRSERGARLACGQLVKVGLRPRLIDH